MKKILSFVLLAASELCHAGPIDLLMNRIAPGKSKYFQFVLENEKSARNFFEVSAGKDRVRIRGNSYISIASGLDWYLKNYCGVSYTYCDSTLSLPEQLPMPQERIYKETYMQIGYSGYDPAQRLFWNWKDWEKEIDRMALSGVNMCPVFTGVESVWMDFLDHYGMTEEQASQYLFHTDRIPKEWLKRQKDLQERIIRRMQQLGISPVYPAFTGVVPQQLTDGKPNLITLPTRTPENINRGESVVSTDEPLFAEMARHWYGTYEKNYGTAPFYWGSTSGQDLPADIQRCLQRSEPEASWIIPTDPYIRKGISTKGLDLKKIVLLYQDMQSDADWKTMSATKTIPWIWNWNCSGIRAEQPASLHDALNQPEKASNSPETASCIQGIGTWMNGSGDFPLAYSLVNNRRWQPEVIDLRDELRRELEWRYGACDSMVLNAWLQLVDVDLNYDPTRSLIARRPGFDLLDEAAHDSLAEDNRYRKISEALDGLTRFGERYDGNVNYRRDLIRLTALQQELQAQRLYRQFCTAFQERRAEQMQQAQTAFLNLIREADSLRSEDPSLCWSHWMKQSVQDARGRNLELGDWSLTLLRKQELDNGSVPALSGLLKEYCYPRWELFFNWALRKMQRGQIAPPQYQGLEEEWYRKSAGDLTICSK